MAKRLGLKRVWFQSNSRTPHYDLVPSKRALAIKYGAKVKTRDDLREELGMRRRKPKPCPVHPNSPANVIKLFNQGIW